MENVLNLKRNTSESSFPSNFPVLSPKIYNRKAAFGGIFFTALSSIIHESVLGCAEKGPMPMDSCYIPLASS